MERLLQIYHPWYFNTKKQIYKKRSHFVFPLQYFFQFYNVIFKISSSQNSKWGHTTYLIQKQYNFDYFNFSSFPNTPLPAPQSLPSSQLQHTGSTFAFSYPLWPQGLALSLPDSWDPFSLCSKLELKLSFPVRSPCSKALDARPVIQPQGNLCVFLQSLTSNGLGLKAVSSSSRS